MGLDHWGYWNGLDNNTSFAPFDTYNENTGDYTLNNTFRDASPNKYNTALLSKIIYPTKGYTIFEYEPQYYGKRVERNSSSNFLPALTNNSGLAGGCRIKRQYDYTENGVITNEKEYKYVTALNSNIGSGILMNWPRYYYHIRFTNNSSTSNLLLKTSSNLSVNSLDSYNVGYPKVFEINKGKGYIEHSFTSYEDQPDLLIPDTQNIKKINSTSNSTAFPENLYKNLNNLLGIDKSILRGKVKSEKFYSQSDLIQPVKTVQYEYTDNLSIGTNNLVDGDNYVSINHLSGYWVQGYKKYFNSSFLKKITTTENFNGKLLTSITENEYLFFTNHNLSGVTKTLPDGTIIGISYSYAKNLYHNKFNPTGYEFLPELVSSNMVGIPIVKYNYFNQKFINSNQTLYTNKFPSKELSYYIVNPKNTFQYVDYLPNPGNPSLPIPLISWAEYPDLEKAQTDLTYDKYDDKGNLLQYSGKGIKPTAMIWGYNQTQPIAKIEGATYDQVISSGLTSSIISASDSDATNPSQESVFIAALDSFRAHPSLSSFQITTYTYDPLVGVTSITPPSGIREVYIYDTANRLKEVRQDSATGKVLKTFKYNYKNQ